MTFEIESTPQSKKRETSFLQKLISTTKVFKVEHLVDAYDTYTDLIINCAFRHVLHPYTRFGRDWLFEQNRDVLAGTDRHRLILTHQERALYGKELSTVSTAKIRKYYDNFIVNTFDYTSNKAFLEAEDTKPVSRQVFDEACNYAADLLCWYPQHTADLMVSILEGDYAGIRFHDHKLRNMEAEIGMRREEGMYVATNLYSTCQQATELMQVIVMSYSRLMYRMSNSYKGATTPEENFSSGYEGMVRAALCYDPRNGTALTKHATNWVQSSIVQRQRQASMIRLTPATWQLISKLNRGLLSPEKEAEVRETYELFYASSSNANKASLSDVDDSDGYTYDNIHVTSTSASYVMGDSVKYSQNMEDIVREENMHTSTVNTLNEAVSMVIQEDPALTYSLLCWAEHSGIDLSLVAETVSAFWVGETQIKIEREKQRKTNRNN
jgi:DNA-directed RNA polymerase sigma subunit (sigma70/sigma32)